MNRHPDIDLDNQDVPYGLTLITGKFLMLTARSAGIPYGTATRRTEARGKSRAENVGIVIAETDKPKLLDALANKNSKRKKSPIK